ncbi:S1-like domain-containing RNA-binding protein [Paenisporosarcina quisquiliarum]|uniref:S1-like domain-containing RNA-binding protein n=1 Tax=Paenisporosarcina quisquiliarum TaxID=365346 RepID=A0A9X3LFD1_9BACL|nr:S1-like domain-containing RNA-binding protein [Paenisporosarcina quisquiliarum]MCZ8536742.1 S1-like domain-containing RNA-binding protein [Paenisporosarcina quisquiliarum]
MSEMVSGEIVDLQIKSQESSKWILSNGEIEVPINGSEAPEGVQEGDTIKVFLFKDRRGNLSATSTLPHITKGTYGWARVIKMDEREGAVVDIGSSREVIVKPSDLPLLKELWPKTGDHLYMTLRTDFHGDLFGRLATEDRVAETFVEAPTSVMNENLKARAYRLLPIGSFFISVPQGYRVFVHHTEQMAEPRLGEEVDVRVIGVKEDGSLNGSMLPRKQERLMDDAETLYRYLQDVGGKMPFTDKSSPDEIYDMFNLSKASFKRALGKLMKEKKIEQKDGWTLVKSDI